MKRLGKILLIVFLFFLIAGTAGYFYLFVDPNVFPVYAQAGLQNIASHDVRTGKSFLSADSTSKNIITDGEWFKDASGRIMNLRGINLGGSSKLPFTPRLTTRTREGFFESAKTVSFVGRPFPLAEADEHFRRLKQWGFQFLRLLVTWEAIEHEGPGIYDRAYLDYIYQIVNKAGAYNINVFIDPHQDVWSRFTGGDGAPLWTLEKAGLDATHFSETGAAIVHNLYGEHLPKMIWPTNYSKLGAATMFTLFFGGKDFAPHTKVDSINIQDYLQDHYINAIRQVALKVKDLPNVVGFDTFNEPSAGYIGLNKLDTLDILRISAMPTYFEGMVAAAGNNIEVGVWELGFADFKEIKKESLNKNHLKAWQNGAEDIWQQHGVWGYDANNKPVLLKNNYFSERNGKHVDFSSEYWKPFVVKYTKAIHDIDARWIIFAEPALFTKLPKFSEIESRNMVNAIHWYDDVTLVKKQYLSWISFDVEAIKPIFGKKNIREYFNRSLRKLKAETKASLGSRPTLIGEFGIPFDLNNKHAYSSGDFSDQEAVIDRSSNAMEANMLSYTLWNYTFDNDNRYGDQWNDEDLSIFSRSQRKDLRNINSGGRALHAVIRPYPYKISGVPKSWFYNKDKGDFHLSFENDSSIHAPTEIFLPKYHYAKGYEVSFTRGKLRYDQENDLLLYYPEGNGEHILNIRKTK
jgi:hypothetical protein